MTELRRHLRRVQRFVARHRRGLAGLLAGLAALLTLQLLAPSPATTAPVVVARHDLAAGTVVQSDDVHVVRLPPGAVPSTAVRDPAEVVGRSTAGPVATDELVTATRLVGGELVAGLGAQQVAAPVRMADDEAVRLLHAGDRIDVYAPTARGTAADVVVSAALVTTLPDSVGEIGQGAGVRASGALVVLAVQPDEAARLAQEASQAPLSFALVG